MNNLLLKLAKFSGLLIVAYIIGYGMLSILRLGPNFYLIAERNQDYVLPLSHLWTNPKDPFIFYIDRTAEWILALGPSTLVVLILLGFAIGLLYRPRETIVIGLWAAVPILAQAEFAKVFTARYILFSLPYLIVLSSSALLIRHKQFKFIVCGIFLFFLVHASIIDYHLLTNPEKAPLPQSERSGYLEEWTAGTGIVQTAEFFKKEHVSDPNRKIVVGTEGFFGTLPNGLQIYLKEYPQITIIGTGLIFKKVPQSLLESKAFGNKTYLVVNSSRFNDKFKVNDYNKLGLKLVASYPKTKRQRTDTHEYLYYGERDYLYLFEVTQDALLIK